MMENNIVGFGPTAGNAKIVSGRNALGVLCAFSVLFVVKLTHGLNRILLHFLVKTAGVLLVILISSNYSFSQDSEEPEKEKKYSLQGYVKDMATFIFMEDSTLIENLVHNRLNFEWFPTDNFTLHVGMRNRVFTGGRVKADSIFAESIDTNNDYLNMSITWVDRDNLVIHSVFDRAYLEWIAGDWEITLGRQRINWGTNVAWNPNDLFNAYSFFDFDYEERPGSDALRVVRYLGVASSVETAVTIADSVEAMVTAGMFRFNKWNYDFQVIGGIAKGDVALGGGWAGNLKTAGFKGEFTYFIPFAERPGIDNAFAASAGIDYSFKNGVYVLGSYLFNSDGGKSLAPGQMFLFSNQQLSARSLIPFKHSALLMGTYQFHPLMNANLSAMTFPGSTAMFVNPGLTFSLTQSLDFSAIGQLFFMEIPTGPGTTKYGALAKMVYVRLKWGF